MENCPIAHHLLNEGFEEGLASMVHGTAKEAVATMFQTGYLPSSFYRGKDEHPANNGYLYFVPRKNAFTKHPLFNEITVNHSIGSMERDAIKYAALIQQDRHLLDSLGFDFSYLYNDDFVYNGEDCFSELQHYGVDTDAIRQYGVRKLREELAKQKGVIIGLKQSAIELLPIENGTDDPGHEVMCYLPNGLPIEHVQYISPIGNIESTFLEQYSTTIPQ